MTTIDKTRKKKLPLGRLGAELLLLALVALSAVYLARWALRVYYTSAYPLKYQTLIDAACEEKGLDKALVYAVVRTESGFRPDAVSNVGARGLMQLMPAAFDWVRMRQGLTAEEDKTRLFDPRINVDCGTEMLRLLTREFTNVENVLCAYHAGRGSVKKWLADPAYSADGARVTHIPFPDTENYVKKVCKTMEVYRKLYNM